MEDPFPLLAEAQSRCPISHSDQYGGFWSLFRHKDIGEAARNPKLFLSSGGASLPSHGFPFAVPPIEIDPPDHIQFRTRRS